MIAPLAIVPLVCLGPALVPVCAEIEIDASVRLSSNELLRAVNGRLAAERRRLALCAAPASSELIVALHDTRPGVLRIELAGAGDLSAFEEVKIAGLSAHEALQVVALRVYEAVRPSLEAWSARATPPGPPAPQEPPAPQGPPPTSSVEPADASFGVAAALGALAPIAMSNVGVRGELAAWSAVPGFDLSAAVAYARWRSRSAAEVSVSAQAASASLGPSWRWRDLALAPLLQARLTRVGVAGNGVPSGRLRWYADGGLALGAQAWLWRRTGVEVGVTTTASLWWRPRRITLGGALIYEQSLWEIFFGPSLQWQAIFPHDQF